jgi:hypothetical protein
VTRHPEQGKIVLSHWRDGLCVASTPIELNEVSALIGVLADALGDAIDVQPVTPIPPVKRPSFLAAVRDWLKPKVASVTELRLVRDSSDQQETG